MVQGRKPGYKHSAETKRKISRSMSGCTKTEEHRDHIASAMYDLDARCFQRLEELRETYPGQEDFFNRNEAELLFAMQGVKSERELADIRRYVETKELAQIPERQRSYQYPSTSCHAVEDLVIELVDFKRFLQKVESL